MTAPAAAAMGKWLSIVGIGESGLDGIASDARAAISGAEVVFGGARHLELAQPAITGNARAWPMPFDAAMRDVVALRGRPVCVLASGDPFWNGVGATLSRHVKPAEYDVHPAPSAFSLAAARLGWALQDVETISLHGRPIELVRPLLQPGVRILALTSDGAAPAKIAGLVTGHGFGPSRIQVFENLGGDRETRHDLLASDMDDRRFDDLNTLAIEVSAGSSPQILPFGGGLPESFFEHDGQITKSEIRAGTLAALRPMRGQLLWDIGAGSGSVSISWMLSHPSLEAIAIEANSERAARIGRNATQLGTPGLQVVEGHAPAALSGLPAPDAIFIGGGGSEPGVMEAAMDGLKPGGRLVANGVTLEMEATLLSCRMKFGGELNRISVQKAEPVGSMMGWRPAMPVTRWTWEKPL